MPNENLKPARFVPPGAVLRRELEARRWSQKDLADIIGRPEQAISEIVQGAKRITPETALELGKAFGTSAELWLGLESKYRLGLAERERGIVEQRDQIGRRALIYRAVPVRELVKRGWINAGATVDSLERAVCEFLGVESLNEEPLLCARFRHSQARCPEPGPQLAWVKRVETVARGGPAPFRRGALVQRVGEVLAFAGRAEDAPRALDAVAALGIRVAVVPHLPQSYVDGVAFFVDRQPIVGLSLRYDRIDAFWFSLMHELAHVARGHRAHLDISQEDDGAELDRAESEANALAGEWLVPGGPYRDFVARYRGHFSTSVVETFAAEIGRHPGIVVGRLQHDKLVPYQSLRRMLVPVRRCVERWLDR